MFRTFLLPILSSALSMHTGVMAQGAVTSSPAVKSGDTVADPPALRGSNAPSPPGDVQVVSQGGPSVITCAGGNL
jgi:hypothetical protein